MIDMEKAWDELKNLPTEVLMQVLMDTPEWDVRTAPIALCLEAGLIARDKVIAHFKDVTPEEAVTVVCTIADTAMEVTAEMCHVLLEQAWADGAQYPTKHMPTDVPHAFWLEEQ